MPSIQRWGFIVHTSDTSQLYGNVSRGYEAPINIQLMQPLNAQSMVQQERFSMSMRNEPGNLKGHRGVARHGDLTWDVVAYDLEMRKEVPVTALRLPGIGEMATYRNARASRHIGVEAGGSIVLAKDLLASSSGRSPDHVTFRGALRGGTIDFWMMSSR